MPNDRVVTCGRTVDEARELLLDAPHEMIASYRDQGRELRSAAGMPSRSRSTLPRLEASPDNSLFRVVVPVVTERVAATA